MNKIARAIVLTLDEGEHDEEDCLARRRGD
jgi:hypothetical protein